MRSRGSRPDRSCASIPRTTTTRRRRSTEPAGCSRPPENRRTCGSRRAAATSVRSTRSRTSTARVCSRSFATHSASSFRRAIRSKRGDDLLDVPEMLELVLEHPPHHFPRRPPPSHHLVLLEQPDVFGHDAIGRQLPHLEGRGVQVFPVLDRHTTRVEKLEVRAESAPRIRDRSVARRPRGDASTEHRNMREPVAALALNVYRGRLFHARTQTFWPQSARIVRSVPSTMTRIGSPCRRSMITMSTPGRSPCESRYSRKPGSCS